MSKTISSATAARLFAQFCRAEFVVGSETQGHWVTVNGGHVFLTDDPVSRADVSAAADRHGVHEEGKAALIRAHGDGRIQTQRHLMGAVAHIRNEHQAAPSEKQSDKKFRAASANQGIAKHQAPKEQVDAFLKARNDRIMGKLPKVSEGIPKMRAAIESDLSRNGLDRQRVGAAVARIMDATTMRVGSEEYATKSQRGEVGGDAHSQDSFGASSLRKTHVRVEGDTVHFEFPGKSKKMWKRSINDPALAKTIKELLELPGDRLMQYQDTSGKTRNFTEVHAGEYLKPHGITPKNLRTYHATKLAAEFLNKMHPTTEKEAHEHVKLAAVHVAEHLGNTPAIALGSYINPLVPEAHLKKVPGSASFGDNDDDFTFDFDDYLKELSHRVDTGELEGEYPACGMVTDDERGEGSKRGTGMFSSLRLFARFSMEEMGRQNAHLGTNPAPSPAQAKRGNYAKGKFVWNGLQIAIENPAGSVREGMNAQGVPWRTRMTCDYGYFTEYGGADGDKLDVLIGPDLLQENVFVVDQKDADGDFDEAKVVIGCADIAEAHALYLSNYQEGWEVNIRNIWPMTLTEFTAWLDRGEGEESRSCFADFSRADFSAGEFVTVPALISRAGNYADKGIELTRQDFDRAARSVSPTSPVAMNMAHLRRGSVLDDAGLGQIERTWRRGDELWGEIAVPKWLASLARERGLKLPVSAEWDLKTKTLRGCAWERTPRIEDAKALLT